MVCTFFGHKDAPESTKETLKSVLINLIEKNDVDLFYVGNHGNFDIVTYVKYTFGGAFRFQQLAVKKGKTVINLAEDII